jgi:hypothetical protein
MVHAEDYKGKKISVCDVCGFGYAEKSLANACEDFCKSHGACSIEITKNAIKR